MLKMRLVILGETVADIRRGLKELSEDKLQSNCTGGFVGGEYDYDFVNSDDLYAEDSLAKVVSPHTGK